jgi:hypothetical protein
MDEMVDFLAALFYHVGHNASPNHFAMPSERIRAVTADLGVLISELEDIEESEDIEADTAASLCRERERLETLRRRLERAANPVLPRRRTASKPR